MNQIHLSLPANLYIGNGAINKLKDEAERAGTKPLIICDPFMVTSGYLKLVTEQIHDASQKYSIFSEIPSEPSQEYVEQAARIATAEQCDYLVALGGGSCLDTAKATAVVLTNNCSITELAAGNFAHLKKPLPLIAIPTTAGTGSEVTDVTVIKNTKSQVKMMLKDRNFLPPVAIVDSTFTLSVPKSITAATGLDALCHALESYVSTKSNSLTKMYSLDALKRILTNLLPAYQDGSNIKARTEMMLASTEAGIAFSNASVTLIHGMSRPIGALFNIPHGLSNAMLLPVFLEFSQDVIVNDLAEIVDVVFPKEKQLSVKKKADFLTTYILKLCQDLSVPSIKDWGVDEQFFLSNLEKMTEDALESGSPQYNKLVPKANDIKSLYLKAYKNT